LQGGETNLMVPFPTSIMVPRSFSRDLPSVICPFPTHSITRYSVDTIFPRTFVYTPSAIPMGNIVALLVREISSPPQKVSKDSKMPLHRWVITDHRSVDRSPSQEYLRFLPRDLTTILRRKMRRSYKRNKKTSLKIWRKRGPSSPPSSLL
jgi:hypothetical protein